MTGNDSCTDQTKTKTKTKLLMSLNERHTRFLQDLPSSRSKPPPAVSFSLLSPDQNDSVSNAEKARRRLSADSPSGEGNIPNFSGMTDFNSPYDDSKRSQLNKEASSRSSTDVVDDRCVSTHAQVATSDPAEDEEKENEQEKGKEKGNDKPYKVKIAGRRRLCKLSSTNTPDSRSIASEPENPVELNSVLNISDFSSPPPPRTVKDEVTDIGGGNEIRDILSDLSARLGLLSLEKRPMPKIFDQQPAPFNRNDPGEYATAASSFASSSSPSSSGVDKKDSVKGKPKVQFKPVLTNTTSIPDDTDGDGDCVILRDEELSGYKKKINAHTNLTASIAVVIPEEDEAADKVVLEDEHSITFKGLRYTYKLPGQIGKMLFPHQREGLKWLWSLHCLGKGGILGDDMGLGKTMQICGYLAGLFHSCLIKRVIIVAPKTLIPHWIKELTAVGISRKIKEYFGTCPKSRQYELQFVLQDEGILLTTYDIVRNNWKSLCDSSFQDDDHEDVPLWDYMILDEGHLIKNPSTQRAQSLLQIPCAHRIIISGTPLQNNLKELWALFNFCCPDLLGDKKWFKEHYEYPILRGNEKRATERERHVGSVVAKKLREHFQPYFLRRLKSEVFGGGNASGTAELSKKNEVIVWLRLTHCQRHLYEAFLKSELVLSAFDGSPLAAITILKKICDHPYLLTKRAAEDVLEGMDSMLNAEDRNLAAKLAMRVAECTEEDEFQEKHDNVSCKISFIMQLLDNLIPEGHNVLIFSQTRKMLNLIQESLVSSGFDFLRIDGTTKSSDRLKIVNDFQDGLGPSIFLLTSQVGGLGLTLTRADRVIVVDPAWNPSTDSQSVDRAYRIGQKKDVLVYRLMTCGTIEEKIYRMQIFKGGLFRTATEQKEQTRYFSQQDLKELFSLPRDGFDISPTQQQLHEEHGDQIVMSDALKGHIKFLESLGIGGVSHHSLLYSKTEPTPSVQEEVDLTSRKEITTSYRYTNPSRVPERPLDGAEFAKFAFKPKDAKTQPSEKVSPGSSSKMTESEIKDRISRLSGILTNKSTVSKLPDGGRKIQRQIEELKHELDSIRRPKQGSGVIEIDDDVADALQRSLYVR